jgi:hypothetical protein
MCVCLESRSGHKCLYAFFCVVQLRYEAFLWPYTPSGVYLTACRRVETRLVREQRNMLADCDLRVWKFWLENYWHTLLLKSRDNSVGIALGYGLDDQGSRIQFPAGSGNFSLHHRLQNGSGAHPASYPVGTRGSFLGGKAAEAWSWPLSPSSAEVEWVELYHHSPNTPSWRGAQLKHRDNFIFFTLLLRVQIITKFPVVMEP